MTSNVNWKWEPKLNQGLVEGNYIQIRNWKQAKEVMERPTPTSKANIKCRKAFKWAIQFDSTDSTACFEGWRLFPEQDLRPNWSNPVVERRDSKEDLSSDWLLDNEPIFQQRIQHEFCTFLTQYHIKFKVVDYPCDQRDRKPKRIRTKVRLDRCEVNQMRSKCENVLVFDTKIVKQGDICLETLNVEVRYLLNPMML